MIRPSSRSCSCNWVSKRWAPGGVRSARRNGTMSRPIETITGTRRTVKGNKDVAKWVAKSSREHVAWSIEASFLVGRRSLVAPVISRESRLLFQSPCHRHYELRADPGQRPLQIFGNPWHWRDCTQPARERGAYVGLGQVVPIPVGVGSLPGADPLEVGLGLGRNEVEGLQSLLGAD